MTLLSGFHLLGGELTESLFSVTLFSVTLFSVTLFSVTLFSVTLFSVTLFSVTLFSVTLLSGFHLLGEELTQSHSFNCHKQLQVKSEAELRSVQNTLNLLNQSLSPTFSRKLGNMKSSEHLVDLLQQQLLWVREQRIMGNIRSTHW